MSSRITTTAGQIVAFSLIFVTGMLDTAVANDRSTTDPATGIIITPRTIPAATAEVAVQEETKDQPEADDLPVISPHPKHTSKYRAIFDSIPFSRAEFDANPSYRHDAAMEILTGNPRPDRTIINNPPPSPPVEQYLPNLPVMRHYFDMSRGPYSRYQHLFGYQGGYRPMYYRY